MTEVSWLSSIGLSILVPWALGMLVTVRVLAKSECWNVWLLAGHGYVLGIALTTFIIRACDAVGLGPGLGLNLYLGQGLGVIAFLLVVNVMLLIAGNFMEPSAILLIMAPILFPIATQLGIDPIHLGIIMVVNMEIGMITPPIGLNLFVTSGITGMSLSKVVRAAMPFVGVLMVFLILVTYVPWISTALPYAMMGPELVSP